MPIKFQPGQTVLVRKKDDCIPGKVISVDDEYTVIQFEDLEHPTVLDEAALADLEWCEEEDQEDGES